MAGTPGDRRRTAYFWSLLVVVLLLGAGWRFVEYDRFPLPFHVTRQYHGANLARRLWLPSRPTPLDAGETRWLAAQYRGFGEPPVVEAIAAGTYRILGEERSWVGPVVSSLFWLGGAFFVFGAARRLARDDYGGLLGLAYYLLCPFGILLSRSFQPDALMVMGMAVALWLIVRAPPTASWRASIALGLGCGVALLPKPGIAFLPVAGAFAFQTLGARGFGATLRDPRAYAVLALMALPSMLWGAFFLASHVDEKVQLTALTDPAFYAGWWRQVSYAAGVGALAAGALGAWLLVRRSQAFLVLGMLTGYLLYSLLFTWHTMTHSYYQAPLIVILSLCIGPCATVVRDGLRAAPWREVGRIDACVAALGLALMAFLFALPAGRSVFSERGQAGRIALYERIGERIGRGSTVISLSEDYGLPLQHHAWLVTRWWPTAGDRSYERLHGGGFESEEARLDALIEQFDPSHFVVTDPRELARQPELQELLKRRLELVVREKDWMAFRFPGAR